MSGGAEKNGALRDRRSKEKSLFVRGDSESTLSNHSSKSKWSETKLAVTKALWLYYFGAIVINSACGLAVH